MVHLVFWVLALITGLGLGDVQADDGYPLPLTSFAFSPGSVSYYSSPYIHLIGNDGLQYSPRIEKSGCRRTASYPPS